jgi:branched-chain amino acid transport system permease protein
MSSYIQALLADVGIGVLGGLSVYVILAVGQLSLGNAAFMAIGAYVASMLTVWSGWPLALALAAGSLASGFVGLLIGFPALRLRGIYLAVATLGFGEMTRSFFLYFEPTGAASGFRGMQYVSTVTIWIWTAGVLAFLLALERSRLWLEFRAVRDDETAAEMSGLDTTRLKLLAFSISAMIGGIAGGLFAHHHIFIEPGNFGFEHSVDLVLIAILGGSEVAIGAVAGSLILNLLPEALRFVGNWRLAAFGALLVLILLVRRQGLLDRSLYRMLGRIAGRSRG